MFYMLPVSKKEAALTAFSFDNLDDKNGNLLHRERSVGHIQRSYRIPDVDSKEISAKDVNGVLTITLPKLTEEDKENTITID